jgi:His-Xaa-Ser system protein HxsD
VIKLVKKTREKGEKKVSMIHNLELHPDGNFVLVSVNPKIYSLDVVYSAAYALMDKAFIIIDGDPAEEILVELRPKDNSVTIEQLGRKLNNELLNYAVYKSQAKLNRGIREAIVKRAFETQSTEAREEKPKEEFVCEKPEEVPEEAKSTGEEESYIDDPLGIAKPWTPPEEEETK